MRFDAPTFDIAILISLAITSSLAFPLLERTSVADRVKQDMARFPIFAPVGIVATPAQRAAVVAPGVASVVTAIGVVTGYSGPTANRYTVPYALPPTGNRRFAPPVLNVDLKRYNASSLPNACAQNYPGMVSFSEDCLYITIYTPKNVNATSKLPVFFFIHGGTFVRGSSTMEGLDGSNLSNSQKSIVVVVQYRLGVLGFAKNDALGIDGNYGMRDVISALRFVKHHIASFGGNPSAVTLVGSSTGAEIVKSLFVTPSATPFFARAILSSAPLGLGDQTIATGNAIGNLVSANLSCTTLACMRSKSVEDILATQSHLFMSSDPMFAGRVDGASPFEPIRAVVDGKLITRDFSTAVQNRETLDCLSKPIIFSTVQDEGCAAVATAFPAPFPIPMFEPIVAGLFGARAAPILASNFYLPGNSSDAVRETLAAIGTDIVWTCPTAQIVSNMTQHQIYLAQFNVGVTSPYSQSSDPLCADRVSHQDDLLMFFDNAPSDLTPAQAAVQAEILARYAAFVHTGKPNAPGSKDAVWKPVTGPRYLNLLVLGANATTGASAVQDTQGNCAVSKGLYGSKVAFGFAM